MMRIKRTIPGAAMHKTVSISREIHTSKMPAMGSTASISKTAMVSRGRIRNTSSIRNRTTEIRAQGLALHL